jgi:hypothetical protein
MTALTILAVVAILAYVIGRQLLGEAIRGKRLIILPAVLTGIGILDLAKHTVHPTAAGVAFTPEKDASQPLRSLFPKTALARPVPVSLRAGHLRPPARAASLRHARAAGPRRAPEHANRRPVRLGQHRSSAL